MSADVAKNTNTVTLTIDGVEVTAPKGALLIRVAEELGIAIPRFCDHPLLAPAGACSLWFTPRSIDTAGLPSSYCSAAAAD